MSPFRVLCSMWICSNYIALTSAYAVVSSRLLPQGYDAIQHNIHAIQHNGHAHSLPIYMWYFLTFVFHFYKGHTWKRAIIPGKIINRLTSFPSVSGHFVWVPLSSHSIFCNGYKNTSVQSPSPSPSFTIIAFFSQ
jgi:hypothetical protein